MAKKTKKKAKAKRKPAKKAAKEAVKKPVRKTAKKTAKKAAPRTAAKAAGKPSKNKSKAAPKQRRGPDPLLAWRIPKPGEILVGVVDDFYSHIGVITFTLRAPLNAGDAIHVRGHTTDLEQTISSMQCEHKDIANGRTGMGVGIKIKDKARRGDYVYKIPEE